VGVYFEANGHGTVLLRPRLIRWLQDAWARRDQWAGGYTQGIRYTRYTWYTRRCTRGCLLLKGVQVSLVLPLLLP